MPEESRIKSLDKAIQESLGTDPWNELLRIVDLTIMNKLSKFPEIMWLYTYLDSRPLGKPLSPREFFEFWESLTMEEQFIYTLTFV